MSPETLSESPIIQMNIAEYFMDSVSTAVFNQHVVAEDETILYVVNLLSSCLRTERFFQSTPEGVVMPPLAMLFAEAVEAEKLVDRQIAFRRLGDLALLTAGLFSGSFSRKAVGADYYLAMGGSAYGALASMVGNSSRERVFKATFEELSAKFPIFVDVLGEVGENAHFGQQTDILRLYEIWMRTGSQRAADHLRSLGIQPCWGSLSQRHN
jgi:hypothetical protein